MVSEYGGKMIVFGIEIGWLVLGKRMDVVVFDYNSVIYFY